MKRLLSAFALATSVALSAGCASVCGPVNNAGQKINNSGEAGRQTAGGVIAVVSGILPPVGAVIQGTKGYCDRQAAAAARATSALAPAE
jgi:hypothetical protein